jgi:hypothetical protein
MNGKIMTKRNSLILLSFASVVLGLYLKSSLLQKNGASVALGGSPAPPTSNQAVSAKTEQSLAPADKIEVVHFHATQQCVSCITVGKYALKTIQDKFPEEYKSGKIVFKEINGELPENREIVTKYQARGSSLFVNAVQGDKDNIAEDVTVWRLINNESQFMDYFESKLNTLLDR